MNDGIELVIDGPRLTVRAVTAAARAAGRSLRPPYSLSVCRFVEAPGLPWPPADGLQDLHAALLGLAHAGAITDTAAVTHIDLRTNAWTPASITPVRTILRLRSYPTREDRP